MVLPPSSVATRLRAVVQVRKRAGARPSEQENLDPRPQRNRRRQEDVSKGEPSRRQTGLHGRSSDLTSELQSSVRSVVLLNPHGGCRISCAGVRIGVTVCYSRALCLLFIHPRDGDHGYTQPERTPGGRAVSGRTLQPLGPHRSMTGVDSTSLATSWSVSRYERRTKEERHPFEACSQESRRTASFGSPQ